MGRLAALAAVIALVAFENNAVQAAPSCGEYCINVCKSRGAMGSGMNNCVSQCTPKCEQQKASKKKQ
jgi:hypothetical protein